MNPAPFTRKNPFVAERCRSKPRPFFSPSPNCRQGRGGIKRIIFFFLLLFLVTLQATLLNGLNILGIKPDFLFILVIFIALHKGPISGAWCGFLAGILLDLFSFAPLGTNALSKTALGFLLGAVAPFLYFEAPFIQGLLLFIAMLLEGIFLFILLSSLHLALPFSHSFLHIILPTSLYTSLLTPLLFYVFKKTGVSDYAF
ncbi:rod shape-determining protein MreD [bacterium]|nr:rod shape-determining protein MreD [bacterium]MBU4560819.1 rod shape-determining protein MreD [bacterium]MCG2678186.1 rod shape-determining protein MreD [bacterium]